MELSPVLTISSKSPSSAALCAMDWEGTGGDLDQGGKRGREKRIKSSTFKFKTQRGNTSSWSSQERK